LPARNIPREPFVTGLPQPPGEEAESAPPIRAAHFVHAGSPRLARISLAQTLAPSARPVFKVCGITRLEDGLEAARLGAWALGLVFAASPRRLEVTAAARLAGALRMILRPRAAAAAGMYDLPAADADRRPPAVCGMDPVDTTMPLLVGVFVSEPAEEIARVVARAGLDAVQLHGEDSGPSPAEVRAACATVDASPAIISAIRVTPDTFGPAGVTHLRRRAAAARRAGADLLLLDTFVRGLAGGSGRSFPWPLARRAMGDTPFLIAGGIRPDNAAAALAASGAAGVDMASGVEALSGVKDHRLLAALAAAVGRDTEESRKATTGRFPAWAGD
jgi:phosphoribosylanthranilate isomerase